MSEHIIICGLGHVGFRVAMLLARLGESAVVIAQDCLENRRKAVEQHFRLIQGDARDERLLVEAGVAKARAVIIVTSDDLTNVAIAMDARQLNPKLNIVVRLFDQKLAEHLEKFANIQRALSASALAAPAFVAAAMGSPGFGSFNINNSSCVIRDIDVSATNLEAAQTVAQWITRKGQAIVAAQRGEKLMPKPPATFGLMPGDRLTTLEISHNFTASGAESAPPSRWNIHSFRALQTGIKEWWHEVPMGLRLVLLSLLMVVLFSVALFHERLNMPFVDALYFVVTVITTVGFGDYNFMTASPAMKLYGVFLMFCGAALLATLFSIVTDLLLGTRFRDVLARGCSEYRGHVIVAGLGNVGFRLVKELIQCGQTAVAIESQMDAENVQTARELIPVIHGNAKAKETLRKAGVNGAKAVIAAIDDDLANLSIALAAKSAQPKCRVVLRAFDVKLADKLQKGLAIESYLSVSAAAAPTFVGAALSPETIRGIMLSNHLVTIFHRKGSVIQETASSADKHCDVPLLVKSPGAATFTPCSPETPVNPSDEIIGARWLALNP